MLKLAAALIAAVLLAAQGAFPIPRPSEPPAKSQGTKAESQSNQAQSAAEQRGTDKSPVVVSLKPTPYHQTERAENQADSKQQAITEQHLADYTWYLVLATVALVIVAAIQALLFLRGLSDTSKAAKAGIINANAALESAENIRHAERAYFQISHRDGMGTGVDGSVSVPMQIRNWGKTPGSVVDRRLGLHVRPPQDQLPTNPPYELLPLNPIAGAFIVPSGVVTWQEIRQVTAPQMHEIEAGDLLLVLFGYVDYEDVFGGRHRAGYARQYIPTGEGSGNLVFVTTPGYNSDMPTS